jgi:predicted lipoprotein with Yx(FWY)xxD motif
MRTIRTYAVLLALAVAAVLIAAACGGSGSSDDDLSSATTVSVRSVDGVGDVLVDAQGAALYAADQEAGGEVLCTDGCATIWDPLTVGEGETPTADDGLSGQLSVTPRPDGARQVTFDGRLLYRFIEDPSPGTVTGNGFEDTFDGRLFTWHVATPSGVSTSSANSTPSSDGYDF